MEGRQVTETQAVAAEMKQRRLANREGLRETILRSTLARPGERFTWGKDSAGNSLRLREKFNFKTRFLESGLVQMEIGIERSRAGKRFIAGTGQKKVATDLFSATRLARHIQESLIEAQEERDAIVAEVEKINARLYAKGHGASPLGLYYIAGTLEEVFEYIENSTNPLKASANEKLAAAIGAIKEAASCSGKRHKFAKRNCISIACSQLTAFRNRMGEWRDREVEGIIAYNTARECYIREERDIKIEKLLRMWVAVYSQGNANRWAVRGKHQKDLGFSMKIEEMLNSNLKHGAKAEIIGNLVKEMECKKYKRGVKPFGLELLDEALEKQQEGKEGRVEARRMLERAALILAMDKPRFVAEHMKVAEGYLEIVSGNIIEGAKKMDAAEECLGNRARRKDAVHEMDAAVEHFRIALRNMETLNAHQKILF